MNRNEEFIEEICNIARIAIGNAYYKGLQQESDHNQSYHVLEIERILKKKLGVEQ